MAAVLEARTAGTLIRAVYCDVLDEPEKNLRDCLCRFDGEEPVRWGLPHARHLDDHPRDRAPPRPEPLKPHPCVFYEFYILYI